MTEQQPKRRGRKPRPRTEAELAEIARRRKGVHGRRPIIETPEQMREQIDAYFVDCEGKLVYNSEGKPLLDRKGKPIFEGRRKPSMAGLCQYLGYSNRCALHSVRVRPGFAEVVDYARFRLEISLEERLFLSESYSAAAFILATSYGWKYPAKESAPVRRVVELIDGNTDGMPAEE